MEKLIERFKKLFFRVTIGGTKVDQSIQGLNLVVYYKLNNFYKTIESQDKNLMLIDDLGKKQILD